MTETFVFRNATTRVSDSSWRVSMRKDNAAESRGKTKHSNGSEPLGANSEIGRKLRQYYDDLLSEEIPDRFAQLLAKLEQVETSQEKG